MSKVLKLNKKPIPEALRHSVWSKYIGDDYAKATCTCCGFEQITVWNFECGHVIPESSGGATDLQNLRPICKNCNGSVHMENMFEFMIEYGLAGNGIDDDSTSLIVQTDILDKSHTNSKVNASADDNEELSDIDDDNHIKFDNGNDDWVNDQMIHIENAINEKQVHKVELLNYIFYNGLEKITCAKLFHCLYPNQYSYDPFSNLLYKLNEHGIYIVDDCSLALSKDLDSIFLKKLEKEFRIMIAKAFTKKMKSKLLSGYASVYHYLSSGSYKGDVIYELYALYANSLIHKSQTKTNPYIFAFTNGIYDLQTFQFRKASSDECITYTTSYDYDGVSHEKINELMDMLKLIIPDPNELEYLLTTISLSLVGNDQSNDLYIWIGSTKSGKQFIRDLIKNTFGAYYSDIGINYVCNRNALSNLNSLDKFIATRQNTRIIVSSELDKNMTLRYTTLKHIIDRNTIEVKLPRKRVTRFTPSFKLIIQSVIEPNIDNNSELVRNHMRLIEFCKKSIDLPADIQPYRLVFFHILVNYYRKFIERGSRFIIPSRIRNDPVQQFIDEKLQITNNDPVQQFIDEKLQITNNESDRITSSALYTEFSKHGRDNKKNVPQSKFKGILISKDITFKKTKTGNVFTGIKFLE